MNLMEQAVEKCYLTRKYENPGLEDGMCAGLRTMNGEGEPCEECKECCLYYRYAEEHDIKQTNADRINSMSIEELAEFLRDVKEDYQWSNPDYPSEEDFDAWVEWLQSETEG